MTGECNGRWLLRRAARGRRWPDEANEVTRPYRLEIGYKVATVTYVLGLDLSWKSRTVAASVAIPRVG